MRMKEMHPLCCIPLDLLTGNGSRSLPDIQTDPPPIGNAGGGVAGLLYKWTNYSKGWRSRWFLLRNGVLSYSKSRRSDDLIAAQVRTIGDAASLSRINSVRDRRNLRQSVGIVHLKILSFRESRSDDRRFYIFTATKTLHLRTNSKKDRNAWIEALASTCNLFSQKPLSENFLVVPRDLSLSTEKLKNKLLDEGVCKSIVNECEQIMLSEFLEIQGQLRDLCEERSTLLVTLRQLEAANSETEPSVTHANDYRLAKYPFSSSVRENYTVFSTTESSDELDKQEVEGASDEEISYFDTHESFHDSTSLHCSTTAETHMNVFIESAEVLKFEEDSLIDPPVDFKRRTKLPDPLEKEKSVSLWSMIKDNVGKDLTRVCLPVYFNEPISSLQKCCEDMEYSNLLDKAYEYGKRGDSLQRILNVAAFAISGYASSEGRHCKPFNPLLGETYEADFPDRGIRFISEKVSHHPTLIACHCEGKGWKFWGDSNLKTKFWGRSIQLDPVGVLTLEFDDGEIFQWSKVTTSIYNLILGKLYCDHHGTMHISGNREFSSKIRFKEQSILDRNPHQVEGFVEDASGKKVASIYGKWDDSLHYAIIDGTGRSKECNTSDDASLLWKKVTPPVNVTRYNLTSFSITLNEITPGLQEKLPPTDSRFRPDQRHLENGEYEKANSEKQRLEKRQRMSRKLQECGWRPKWFQQESETGPYKYAGGYWESRKDRIWDGCPDIFGEFDEDAAVSL